MIKKSPTEKNEMWNTPDLCDAYPQQVNVLPPVFQSFGGRLAFCGEVETVKCFEDNSRVKELLGMPGENKVLVVDGGGSLRCALIGDLIAASAVANGWAGVVIHGCCRDVHELKKMDFGVMALNSFPKKSTRKGLGEQHIDVTIEGILIRPGHWIYADETGIVTSPIELEL